MYQTVEAIVRNGRLVPVEPVEMEENARFLLVRLTPQPMPNLTESVSADEERQRRLAAFRASRGKYRGLLSSVDEFITHKQEAKELER